MTSFKKYVLSILNFNNIEFLRIYFLNIIISKCMTYIISYRSRIAKKTCHRKINLACDKNIIEKYCVNSTIPQLLEHMKYIYKSQQIP